LQLLQCNGCRVDADGSVIIGDRSAVLINTGKTPAIDMVVKYTFISQKTSDPSPTYDALEEEQEAELKKALTVPSYLPPDMAADVAKTLALVARQITPSKEVLAPNASRGITIIAGLNQGQKMMARMEDRNTIYGLGKLTYFDASRTRVTDIRPKHNFSRTAEHLGDETYRHMRRAKSAILGA
jgi:hypothetical protein